MFRFTLSIYPNLRQHFFLSSVRNFHVFTETPIISKKRGDLQSQISHFIDSERHKKSFRESNEKEHSKTKRKSISHDSSSPNQSTSNVNAIQGFNEECMN